MRAGTKGGIRLTPVGVDTNGIECEPELVNDPIVALCQAPSRITNRIDVDETDGRARVCDCSATHTALDNPVLELFGGFGCLRVPVSSDVTRAEGNVSVGVPHPDSWFRRIR
jgi:hypothetical protein